MKCGGCFYALGNDEQDNVMSVIRTLKEVARFHRGKRGPDSPYFLLMLAKPRDEMMVPIPFQTISVDAYLICQVSLSPLDLTLWKCTVTPYGTQELCDDMLCPRSFSASLDYTVHTLGERSQTMPKMLTMHQLAFAYRNTGFSPFVLRLFGEYDTISLCAIRIADANRSSQLQREQGCLGSNGQGPGGGMMTMI